MNVIAAALCYKMPHLVTLLRQQLPSVYIVDNGSTPPLQNASYRIEENKLFVGGWNLAMKHIRQESNPDYVWMLNSDVQNISEAMLNSLVDAAEATQAAVVTPAFNSPHAVFHPQELFAPRKVHWIDWTCPLVSMKAWKLVGPFDDHVDGYGADLDWCKRARDAGFSFYVMDSLIVNHLGSLTSAAEGITDMQDFERMNNFLCSKWHVRGWYDLT